MSAWLATLRSSDCWEGVPRTLAEERRVPTLAEKLNHLFATIHPRDHPEYSSEEVAEGIRAQGGPTISATYIWQLRKGLRDNPTKKHLEALAGFFRVPPAYFFDDEAAVRIEAELELLAALRDAPVRQIALRASGLSPESLRTIAEVIERVRQLERLPDGPVGCDAAGSEMEFLERGASAPDGL